MAGSNTILTARKDGYVAGWNDARKQMLEFLEEKYMADDILRETPEAAAILNLARELSQLIGAK